MKLTDIAQRVEMSTEKTMRLLNEMRESGELRTQVEGGDIVVFEQEAEDNEEKLFEEMESLERRTQCLKASISLTGTRWFD